MNENDKEREYDCERGNVDNADNTDNAEHLPGDADRKKYWFEKSFCCVALKKYNQHAHKAGIPTLATIYYTLMTMMHIASFVLFCVSYGYATTTLYEPKLLSATILFGVSVFMIIIQRLNVFRFLRYKDTSNNAYYDSTNYPQSAEFQWSAGFYIINAIMIFVSLMINIGSHNENYRTDLIQTSVFITIILSIGNTIIGTCFFIFPQYTNYNTIEHDRWVKLQQFKGFFRWFIEEKRMESKRMESNELRHYMGVLSIVTISNFLFMDIIASTSFNTLDNYIIMLCLYAVMFCE
jgi:hypothetical protein